MAFVMPAGDYERALRLSKGSSFMEALEAGVDRNIRREAQREALRQQRDLYERGLGLEKERLAEKHLSGIEGYDRDFPAVATAGANEAALADVVTAASTQAAVDGALAEEAAVASPDTSAIHAKIRENRMARRAAQGVPVVQATPDQVEQAVVAATTPIQGVTPRAVGVVEEELPGDPTSSPIGAELQVEPRALDPRQSAFVPGTSQIQVEPRALDSVYGSVAPRGESQREVQLREAVRLISEGDAVSDAAPDLEGGSRGWGAPPSRIDGGVPTFPGEGRGFVTELAEYNQAYDQTPGALFDRMYEPDPDVPKPIESYSDKDITYAKDEKGIPTLTSVREAPTPEPTPLEAAIATGAEASERAELVGPEVEVSTAPVEVIDEKTGTVHTVKPGEFVYGIAKSYGASPQALIKANQSLFIGKDGKARSIKTKGGKLLAGADLIFPGEKLRIPTGEGRETGGPAGPVDTREGVKEGVLAKAEKGAKSEKEVLVRLEKEQAKRTSVPLNPFQAFGRDIGYTPSIGAVAYATHMAEQGDFSMINMMAGRVVKNAEIPGLFARYSNFASGARRRSKEILLEEKLAKETQANAAKQRASMGVRTMALTQFQRAGHSLEDAQLFAGHYADLWAVDPQQARAWSTSLNAMGTELARAEAETIKHGRKNYTGRGDRRGESSYSSKDLSKAESRLDKLGKARGDALEELAGARGISEAALLSGDELAKMAADPIHQEMTRAYRQANARYEEQRRNIKTMKEANLSQDVIDREIERAKNHPGMAGVAKSVRDTKKEGWGDFESTLVSKFGLSNRAARGLRDYYESQGEEFYEAVQTPKKKGGSTKELSVDEISSEIERLSGQKATSLSADKEKKVRLANLEKDIRGASNREVSSRVEKATSEAEGILDELNSGGSPDPVRVNRAMRELKSLLGELVGMTQTGKFSRDLPSGRIPKDFDLRPGTKISESISNLRYLLSTLGE